MIFLTKRADVEKSLLPKMEIKVLTFVCLFFVLLVLVFSDCGLVRCLWVS